MNQTQEMTQTQLWEKLKSENHVVGEMGLLKHIEQPWYVRVMLGFSGWLGALFLLGFLFISMSSFLENASAMAVMGLVCSCLAYFMFKKIENNDFGTQFGLAVSMMGQSLLLFAIISYLDKEGRYIENRISIILVIALVYELIMILIISNVIHRFLTACASLLCLVMLFLEAHMHGLMIGILTMGFVYIWLSKKLYLKPQFWVPIAYAFVMAVLIFNIFMLDNVSMMYLNEFSEDKIKRIKSAWIIGEILGGLAWLAATWMLLKKAGFASTSIQAITALAASVFICIAGYLMPGIASAVLILLIGFSQGNRLMFGLGVVSLIGFMSNYYYLLEMSLLSKSYSLAIIGGCMLICRYAYLHYFSTTQNQIAASGKENNHA